MLLEESMRKAVEVYDGREAMRDLFVKFLHQRVPLLDLLFVFEHLVLVEVAKLSPQVRLRLLDVCDD